VRYLLDTDTCIYVLRHDPAVVARLVSLSPDDVATSAMNEAELWYGALNSQHPEKYRRDVEAFLAPIEVLAFAERAAREHARLRLALKSAPIGERDLVIASVAVAHRLILVTHNQREFARVPGLSLDDWFAPPPRPSAKAGSRR